MNILIRFIKAVPGLITAGLFLTIWLWPAWIGASMIKWAVLIMLVEFFLVHASGILSFAGSDPDTSARKKWTGILGFLCLYLPFIAVLSASFHSWVPVLFFGWLLVPKLPSIFSGRNLSQKQKEALLGEWVGSVYCYVGVVFVTAFLPVPQLGITPEIQNSIDLPGTGLWVGEPQTAVAAGCLYFLGLFLLKTFDVGRKISPEMKGEDLKSCNSSLSD